MDSAHHALKPPHFPLSGPAATGIEGSGGAAGLLHEALAHDPSAEVGVLLLRGADCLAAVLADCTSEAGLNESRYRVLAALQRGTSGECSQSDLADRVLQSESNLSTLLERMGSDGLITRARSQTDRRRSLIRVTPRGLAALSQAERSRVATLVRLMRQFSRDEAQELAGRLRQLVTKLEMALETESSGVGPLSPPAHVLAAGPGRTVHAPH